MLIAFLRIMKLIRFGEVKRSLGLIVKKQEERNKHSYVHGFGLEMDSILISFELISICMSLLIIVANLRTPVIVKEGTTLELSSVLRY